jgi:hypothetical protein
LDGAEQEIAEIMVTIGPGSVAIIKDAVDPDPTGQRMEMWF